MGSLALAEREINETMNISAIIPAYNAEATIERAMKSVISQEHSVDEIIVVDDGSSDRTAQIVGDYGSAARYFFQDNAGVSTARNLGIMNSRCEWIAFLDADDEWLPNWVTTQQGVLENHPDLMWSHCSFRYAGRGFRDKAGSLESVDDFGTVYFFAAVLSGMHIGTPGFLIHRSILDKVGMFNPDLNRGEDIDLWSRIAMRFPEIGYSKAICWRCWVDNMNSLTRTEHPRDQQMKNICENILLARSLGKDVLEAYYPYARKRAMSYILRAVPRKALVNHDVLIEAKKMFPLTLNERVLEAILKVLPNPITEKVVARLVD